MLTDKPNIVIAKPPRRIRRKAAVPVLTRIVVDHGPPDMPEDEHERRREAADRLWQELVRRRPESKAHREGAAPRGAAQGDGAIVAPGGEGELHQVGLPPSQGGWPRDAAPG